MKGLTTALLAALGYIAAAIGFNWPLPRHLATALPGPVGGDTGVYVWNLWLFRHEIVVHHRLPYFTTEILSLTPPVDLSLHNYTVFSDILAFPLIPRWGPVVAYNLVYLASSVLAAMIMFALARRLCRSNAAAWLAGLLFAWSPAIVARGEGHLSLVNVAALPAFVLAFDRWRRRRQFWDSVVVGIVLAWAVVSDPYYGVYCVFLAVALITADCVRISRTPTPSRFSKAAIRALHAGILLAAAATFTIAWTGGWQIAVGGLTVSAFTLYTPVLLLTVLVLLRVSIEIRPRVVPVMPPPLRGAVTGLAGAAIGCALPLLPFLIALSARMADGGRLHAPILWRSSPPGVDLLALVTPNPNSVFVRGWLRPWLERQPGGFVENVASLTFVALAVVAFAVWRHRFQPSRRWLVLTGLFALLTLGPFVHVAGANTYVPGPWALLRYVPVLGSARMPARFAAPMMMGLALLFAESLAFLAGRQPARARALFTLVGAALAVELLPAPRPLYDARVPAIYRTIAADPRRIRVMELPLGFRDGESSYGNFSAASQFYQTFHQKPLIGGYLSRISRRELERQFQFPVVRTLTTLSEGGEPTAAQRQILLDAGRRFAARAHLGYVVIDRARTPEPLRELAIASFRLVKIGEDAGYELYQVPLTQFSLDAADTALHPMPPIPPIDR